MYRFKRAESPDEFEQVFSLNHEVFASELGQHASLEEARLVDKFHDKNQYAIALWQDRVVGMIAFHDQPPYSAAAKLADPVVLDAYGKLAEIRLLAIEPEHRNGTLVQGLFVAVYEQSLACDAMLISGRVEEEAMYRTLGFRALGAPVKSGEASYIPMLVKLADLKTRAARWQRSAAAKARNRG